MNMGRADEMDVRAAPKASIGNLTKKGLIAGTLLTLIGYGMFIMLEFPSTCTRYTNYCYGIEPPSVRVLVSTFSLALGSMGIVIAIGSLRRR
ncbi:hypothetical protein E6H16_04840 [Candidatus Bathyarchaeota archaeon]|nr:MAG: hypothetical protein E6H16_04840 [Candidatus Bathyarchaeota archaeon]